MNEREPVAWAYEGEKLQAVLYSEAAARIVESNSSWDVSWVPQNRGVTEK